MGIQVIKDSIKHTRLYEAFKSRQERNRLHCWEQAGRPVPPPQRYKREQLVHYARTLSLEALVETGTCLGDTIYSVRDAFSEIYSIELDDTLFQRASRRLSSFSHITLFKGDSAKVLPSIVPGLTRPCLFWLDAHYSGGVTAKGDRETPIENELSYILTHCPVRHAILIDDAREFTGSGDYPLLSDLRTAVLEKRPDWVFETRDDIIRIHEQPQK